MDDILKAIEDALKEKGMSASAASKAAVGHPAAIKNLMSRRGSERIHPIEGLEQIAKVLGLEFYVGPPRITAKAIPATEIDGDEFVTIPLYAATASAGPGSRNDTEEVERHLMFRRDWMRGLNVSLDHARLLRARGDSMHPVIHDGDLIMIDTSRNQVPLTSERRRRSIWVIRDDRDGDIRVKWLDRPEGSTIIVSSQDADTHPPKVLRAMDGNHHSLVGQVVWWGHSER